MRIVCLCGSTKFKKQFEEANKLETLNGNIVLTVGFFTHADKETITDEQKARLDILHLRKIDMCDEVVVLSVDGYIGDSTKSEIQYANYHNKPVRYINEDTKK